MRELRNIAFAFLIFGLFMGAWHWGSSLNGRSNPLNSYIVASFDILLIAPIFVLGLITREG
jgi:hypothetical protein